MGSSAVQAPRSVGAILAEIGGAVVGGLVLAVAGYFLAFVLFRGAGLGMGLLTVQIFGAVLGFGVGAGIGTAVVGRLLGQRGSWWIAVLASVGSGAAALLIMRLLNLGGLGGLLVVGVGVTLLAAVAGYNVRRGS